VANRVDITSASFCRQSNVPLISKFPARKICSLKMEKADSAVSARLNTNEIVRVTSIARQNLHSGRAELSPMMLISSVHFVREQTKREHAEDHIVDHRVAVAIGVVTACRR
jgi:hypothetical protein